MVDNSSNNSSDEWVIDNLPNRLTMFRVLLIPIIIGCLYLNLLKLSWLEGYSRTLGYVAAWTFVVASITDFFDGYIARKRQIVTVFGSFLDPIADKFLVVSSLIILLGLERIPVIIVIILVLREIYITALRLLAHEKGFSVPVSNLGKWKTTAQMIGTPMLMVVDRPWGIPMPEIGITFIYIAAIFSFYSALQYTHGLVKRIRAERVTNKEYKKKLKEVHEHNDTKDSEDVT